MLAEPSGQARPLLADFAASADADVSFDGKRVLFAGKRQPADPWQVFEADLSSGAARQLTQAEGGCRQPFYHSRLFTLEVTDAWNPLGCVCSGSLHSVKLDGSDFQRLTWTPEEAKDPLLLSEGRIAFSSGGRLFAINLDGTDYALFALGTGANPRMAGAAGRQVVFVEGSGSLGMVSLDRPLHSYKPVAADAVYGSPSALANGEILVSRKSAAGRFEIWRLDPASGRKSALWQDATADLMDARLLAPRAEPDGRGSVVDPKTAAGWLYCLNVRTSDDPKKVANARRLRVLTGPPAAPAKLGELNIEDDGSFHLELPANAPVKLELLGPGGEVLRGSSWFWVRNKEHRGCIGCHEDPELAPENREAAAVNKKPVSLLPPARSTGRGTK